MSTLPAPATLTEGDRITPVVLDELYERIRQAAHRHDELSRDLRVAAPRPEHPISDMELMVRREQASEALRQAANTVVACAVDYRTALARLSAQERLAYLRGRGF